MKKVLLGVMGLAIVSTTEAQTFYYSAGSQIVEAEVGSPSASSLSLQVGGVGLELQEGSSNLYWFRAGSIWYFNVDEDYTDPNHNDRNCESFLIGLENPLPVSPDRGSLHFDVDNDWLYWADRLTGGTDNDRGIHRVNVKTLERETVVSGFRGEVSAITSTPDYLYWSQETTSTHSGRISRMSLATLETEIFKDGISPDTVDLDYDPIAGRVYWTAYASGQPRTSIFSVSVNDPGDVQLGVFDANAVDFDIDVVGRKIYWLDADAKDFYVADIGGANKTLIFDAGGSTASTTSNFVISFPQQPRLSHDCQSTFDSNADRAIDLFEFARLQNCMTGPSLDR